MNRIITALLLIAGTCAAGDAPSVPPGGEGSGDKPPHQGPPDGARPPRPEELFKMADANGDGKVSKEELAAALDKQRKAGREKMFEAMDANHDGNVSKEEFMAFEPPQPPGGKGEGGKGEGPKGPRQPSVDQMFKHFDLNGDGFITEDEIKQAKEQRQGKEGKDGGAPPAAPAGGAHPSGPPHPGQN